MQINLKKMFQKKNDKQSSSAEGAADPYDLYDAQDELSEPSEPQVATIERDITSKRAKILIPKVFGDVKVLADELKQNKVVLVDLSQLDKVNKRRVIDFISGVIYINDGSQKKLEQEIYKLIIRK